MLHEEREVSCLSPGGTSRCLWAPPPLGDATGPATLRIAGCAPRRGYRDGAELTVSSRLPGTLPPHPGLPGPRRRPDLLAGPAPAA